MASCGFTSPEITRNKTIMRTKLTILSVMAVVVTVATISTTLRRPLTKSPYRSFCNRSAVVVLNTIRSVANRTKLATRTT